ncbi:MAG: 3-deoxy-manno-octulosonate cytidylyltransferase [Bacteroidales bacterium]|nr:3-deoxy-manno-octulosonate cytidylyltransferase [Bacteroidales bacterium]
MKTLGIIPARYDSSRFPGKPLVDIDGKSMIRRVYEQAAKCKELSKVIVATDHEGIRNHVLAFGGEAVMTSAVHRTGTERCAEALSIVLNGDEEVDIIVNIQGDEPFIFPEQISEVIHTFSHPDIQVSTLARKIGDPEMLKDPNVVKLVFDDNHRVLYFSRSEIPYNRSRSGFGKKEEIFYFEHVGIYGFRKYFLQEAVTWPESSLERAESLEQLRWLQHGSAIYVHETAYKSISIDSPADLLKITNRKG